MALLARKAFSRRSRRTIAGVVALTLVVGFVAWQRYRAPATDHAVRLVPADAAAYLHVFLKPSTQQRRALQSLLERFPETDEEEEAETFVADLLREVLARFDLNVGRDAGEWLGNEAAAYLMPGEAIPIVMLAVDDADRAAEELADALPRGALLEIVDGFAVIGSPAAVEISVTAGEERSLAESDPYEDLAAELDPHRIASLFVADLERMPPDLRRAVSLRADTSALISVGVTEAGMFLEAITSAIYTSLPIRGYASVGPLGIEGVIRMPAKLERAILNYVPGLSGLPSAFDPLRLIDSPTAAVTMPPDIRSAAEERLGGYSPKLSIDLAAVPAVARRVIADRLPSEFRSLVLQARTVDVGARLRGALEWDRLVVTFGDG